MSTASSQEWVQLQRKIFSRWCRQKLIRRHDVKVTDIVEDLKDGVVLFAIVEELSETKYTGGAVPKQGTVKGRIKQIESLNNALKFAISFFETKSLSRNLKKKKGSSGAKESK